MLPPVVDRIDAGTRIADVRWYLDGRSGRTAYEAGHIPGAVWVDLDRWLAGPASPASGRHPLPDPALFAAGMAACGIGDGDPVVAYDDAGGSIAARLVWLLRVLDHPAALLDGGLQAWSGPLERGAGPEVPAAVFTPRPWPVGRLATADDAAGGHGAVIDARAPERYRGDTEPVDPRAGHIPGARNVPWSGNLDTGGRWRDAEELRERYAVGLGEPVIVYCGSGVTACHDLLALERAGHTEARLYAGSWSQWSNDTSRPVATGEAP